jgi:hypothetical protein
MKTKMLLTVGGGLGLFLTGVLIGHMVFTGAPNSNPEVPGSPLTGTVSQASALEAAHVAAGNFEIDGTDVTSRLLAGVAIRDFFKRRQAIYEVAQQLDEAGVRAAVVMSAKFSPYARSWVRPQLIARWIDLNPEGAYAWANQLPKSERDSMLREFYQTLALKMPGEALRFLEREKSIPGSSGRYLYEVFDIWGANDPLAAADAAARLTDPEERRSATHNVLRRLAQQNPAEAMLRVAALPDDQRIEALSTVIGSLAARNVDAAWESANALDKRGERQGAFSSIISAVAGSDPARAVELARALPADVRVGAISRALANMYDNPEVAAELILMLPASRQVGNTSSVAHRLAEGSTSRALEWAQKLTNRQAREMAISSIVGSSNLKEPKLVLDFLEHFPTKNSHLRENRSEQMGGERTGGGPGVGGSVAGIG